MTGPWSTEPLVIRESRQRAALKLGCCILLSFLCFRLTERVDGQTLFFSWMFLAVGLLGMITAVSTLVRPGRLVLDDQGFSETRLTRGKRWLWREIGPVHLQPVGFIAMSVAFDDLRPQGRNSLYRRWLRHEGIEGGFLGGWTMPLEPLAEVLEARRRAALGESPLASGDPPR